MVFTGVPTIVVVSDSICRITGLSLLAGASGTISLPQGTGDVKLPAAFNAEEYEIFQHVVALNESIDITTGPFGIGGGTSGSVAEFFGTTTGVGSTQNDYAVPVPVQVAPGTGRVPFPQNGPAVGGNITRNGVSTNEFLCNVAGTYRISWQVGFQEISQLQLTVNDILLVPTANLSGAINQQNTNRVVVNLLVGDRVSLVNPAGNGAALTVQPAGGTTLRAQAPNIVFESVATVPVLAITKSGATLSTFLATIANVSGGPTSGLEIYVKFHT